MTQIAPAALASTFVTSIVGALTYGILALTSTGDIAPKWTLGLLCGAGGLTGGYLGARLQPYLPRKRYACSSARLPPHSECST